MPRESIITILRSLSADTPTGLTFGEFGFAGASRKLFIGGTGGGATVESVWVGASITGEALTDINEENDLWPNGQDANNTLSTSKAIRTYVDAAVGTKGDVNSVNADIGIITITGAGNNAAVVVRRTSTGTHLIDARIATNTGVTGVASFSSASFNVGTTGVVTLKNPNTFIGVQGNPGGSKVDLVLGDTLTLTGTGSIRTIVSELLGVGANVVFDNRMASATLTGVASFDPRHFAIGLSGHVSLTGSIGADSVRMASGTLTGVASFDPRHFAIGLSGHVSLTGPYQVTGDTVVAGNSISVVRSNNQATITNMGVTGIGFGNDKGLTGKINLTGAGAASSQVITVSGNQVILDNRVATNSLTGVASFSSGIFSVTNGVVNLESNTLRVRGSDNSSFDSVIIENYTTQDPLTLTITGSAGIYTTVTEGVDAGRSNNPQVTIYHTGVFSSGLSATGITANSVFTNKLTATNASFASGVTFSGTVSGAVKSVNGNDGIVTITGSSNNAAIIVRSAVAGTHLIDARMASGTLTGVASFDPRHFALGVSGHVSLTGSYQVTGNTVVSVGSSQVVNVVGNIANIDNKLATINGQTGVAAFTNNFQISPNGTVDLADNVTIAGNLTVQGDVVTANVSNFTVQDTLIKLGTGNNLTTSIYDLGFYMQYPVATETNNIRLAGFFLDYEDTKFKLFTGLTASAQDGTTGTDQAARLNTDRQGYTVATLIARLDGGTF